jgi:hypothetical protein
MPTFVPHHNDAYYWSIYLRAVTFFSAFINDLTDGPSLIDLRHPAATGSAAILLGSQHRAAQYNMRRAKMIRAKRVFD